MRGYGECNPHDLGLAATGESVRFLGKNGHDIELQDALGQFAPGTILTIESCFIGGWVSYYRFAEHAGLYNTVMFAPLASADTHPKDGDAVAAPLVSGAVPKADAQ